MKLKKIVTLMSAAFLVTGLSACNLDGASNDDNGGDTPAPTPDEISLLTGGLWQISGSEASYSNGLSADPEDLPNIYVFDGNNQRYYNDDDDFGTYTITTTPYIDDPEAKTLQFDYYATNNPTEPTNVSDGTYTVSNGILTIDSGSFGTLTGTDQVDNAAVNKAVSDANADAGINNVVKIVDTKTDDTGELRLQLADSSTGAKVDHISSGKFTLDLVYQPDLTIEPPEKASNNAYISFYASSTKQANLYSEIVLGDGRIQYRNASGDITDTGGTFKEGEKLAIEANWDSGQFTFTINGTTYLTDVTDAVNENQPVTVISVRLGNQSDTSNYEVLADNFQVYSNDTVIFEDNFDGYPVGQALTGNPYNSSTSEATVISGSTDDTGDDNDTGDNVTDNFDSYTVGENISSVNSAWSEFKTAADTNNASQSLAVISDDQAKSGSNSLLLSDRDNSDKPFAVRKFAAPATTGSISFDAYIPSGNDTTTYINVGTGESNSDRYFELRLSAGGSVEVAAEVNEKVDSIDRDAWNSFTLAWDDGAITVYLNGKIIKKMQQSETGLASEIPSQLTLYSGNTQSENNKAYFDNIDSDLF
ncbi:hypothetical protein [Vibrio rumoiensis]|uniref:hypothetical protein n=1 Tax=Vibrio rumoiensis TaxID=76258 RepID=UPI000B5CFCD3|nr:hypothetical protein [Vibrio rumoiensis]